MFGCVSCLPALVDVARHPSCQTAFMNGSAASALVLWWLLLLCGCHSCLLLVILPCARAGTSATCSSQFRISALCLWEIAYMQVSVLAFPHSPSPAAPQCNPPPQQSGAATLLIEKSIHSAPCAVVLRLASLLNFAGNSSQCRRVQAQNP